MGFSEASLLKNLHQFDPIFGLSSPTGRVFREGETIHEEQGELDEEDMLEDGRYVDTYRYTLIEGMPIIVDLLSEDFDSFLILSGPDGKEWRNDDYLGDSHRSRMDIIPRIGGLYTVKVTSFGPGETGSYRLSVISGLLPVPGMEESVTGMLTESDPLEGNRHIHWYLMEVRMGQELVVDLRGEGMDTFLILRSPIYREWTNDDFSGKPNHSRLEMRADQTGLWRIGVTTFDSGETGRYTLRVKGGEPGTLALDPEAQSVSPDQEIRERLEKGDSMDDRGQYRDTYRFLLDRETRVTVNLNSSEFDTYLILEHSDGVRFENDDFRGSTQQSQIAETLTLPGEWRIIVTSFGIGEGDYRLSISGEGIGTVEPVAPTSGERETMGPVRIEEGVLEDAEKTKDGRNIRWYTFEGARGYPVQVDLQATFDCQLILESPGGERTENDDFEGRVEHSRVDLILGESGTWRIGVTSYSPEESGSYVLRIYGEGVIELHPMGKGRVERGTLKVDRQGRDRINRGIAYEFIGEKDWKVVLDLTSNQFDPYLFLVAPSGRRLINESYEGSTSRARIEHTLDEAGVWTAVVSSQFSSGSGDYVLVLEGVGPESSPENVPENIEILGNLSEDCETLEDGRYFQSHEFQGFRGLRVSMDMNSEHFSPCLMITDSQGNIVEGKDALSGSEGISRDFVCGYRGLVRVYATSSLPGDIGSYRLKIVFGAPPSQPGQNKEMPASRSIPDAVSGTLGTGSLRLPDGRFSEVHLFVLLSSENLIFDLRSRDFDPFLQVRTPSGRVLVNDDWQGRSDQSRIDLANASPGEYAVTVTTFRAGEMGQYRLSVDLRE